MVLPPATVYAAVVDCRQRRVPNRVTAAVALSGLAVASWFGGWAGAAGALAGLTVGFGVLVVPWAMGAMGAGDVKLMAAIGAWFGPSLTLLGLGASAICGGLLAAIVILGGRRWSIVWANLKTIAAKCCRLETAFGEYGSAASLAPQELLLPYAVPLTAGSLLVLAGKCLGWTVI